MNTLGQLACLVEEQVHHEIATGFLHEADENSITHNILVALRKLLKYQQVQGPEDIIQIRSEAYKYRGKIESQFGDIGVLVNIDYRDGDTTDGVGFLEAKVRNQQDGRYRAFKLDQIQGIHSNAPFSFIFPYDYAPVQETWNGIDIPYKQFCKACNDDRWLQAHSIVIPTGIVVHKEKEQLTTDLYKYALPFAYQLCFRYLLGFDLNFAPHPLKSARQYIENRPTPFVLVVSVSANDNIAPSEFVLDDGIYERLSDEIVSQDREEGSE